MAELEDIVDEGEEVITSTTFTGTGGVVEVGGREWAVGLIWEGLRADRKGITRQARDMAPHHGADLLAIRSKAQYALGSTEAGHKPGMKSLAAALAAHHNDPLLGCFPVPGGFYLVAVRDDMVLPGRDTIVEDAHEAQNAFHSMLNFGSWSSGTVFAPAEWGAPDSKPDSLEDALVGAKAKTRLRPLSRKGTVIRAVAGLAIVSCLVGGYMGYQALESARQTAAQQEAMRRASVAAMEAQKRAAAAAAAAVMPWEGKPVGLLAMKACEQAIMAAPLDLPGWVAGSITCDGTTLGISETLKRDGGTINWLAPALDQDGFHPTIAVSGTDATIGWNAPVPGVVYDHASRTSPLKDDNLYLTKQFDELGIPVALVMEKDSAQPGAAGMTGPMTAGAATGMAAARLPSMPVPHSLSFSFKTSLAPSNFIPILAPLRALVLDNVSVDLSGADMVWSVTGHVWEKTYPKPPAVKSGHVMTMNRPNFAGK